MKTEDYCIFIISYGRPEFLKNKTWRLLERLNSSAKKYIVCSDDDSTLQKYKDMYGEETVIVFNKEECERSTHFDLMDCYHGEHNNKAGAVWARNMQYKLARKLGYRWFMMFDDDYISFHIRNVFKSKTGKKYNDAKCDFYGHTFDEYCLKMFDVLNSSPWLYALGSPQGGDYVASPDNDRKTGFVNEEYKFKAMNVFWFDCEKEIRFYGRTNEDCTAYVLNGSRGELSLTMHGPQIRQVPTQLKKGGMTDIYKYFGTYTKSLYSSMALPSGVYVNVVGGTKNMNKSIRIHHLVKWNNTVPKIIDDKYCKGKPSDYLTECIRDDIQIDDNGDVIEIKNDSFIDSELVENFNAENNLEMFI